MLDDAGRFDGRYLQALAAIMVLGMVVAIFRGTVLIDLSFVLLFWAGSALIRHSPLARRFVIVGSAMTSGLAVGVLLMAGRIPLEGVGVSVLGVPVPEPSATLVALLGGVLLVTALVPLVLLLSRRAREEFGAA